MAGKIVASTINDDTGVLATQNGMTGIAKAWVNFNGTGTVAIRDSFNVSSITDNGAGDYTINFTTAMPNANFAAFVNSNRDGAGSDPNWSANLHGTNPPLTTTSVRICMGTVTNFTAVDSPFCCVSVFSS